MEPAVNDNLIQEPKVNGSLDERDSGIGSSPSSSRESTLSGASNSPAHDIEGDGDQPVTHPVLGVNNMENSSSGASSRNSTEDERDGVEVREEHNEMGEEVREEGSEEETSEESSDEDINGFDSAEEEDESLDDDGSSVDPGNFNVPDDVYNQAQEYNYQRSTRHREDYGPRGDYARGGENGEHYTFDRRKEGKPPKAGPNPEEEPDEEYFVKDQRGHNHTIILKKGAKVDDLMEEVYRKTGVPVEQQRLQTDMGKNLLLGASLGATGFIAGATAILTGRLRGGLASQGY